MEIVLRINNEDKTFTAPFVSARKLKETMKLSEKLEKTNPYKILDDLELFIVDLYGEQFTRDQLLDGHPANTFIIKAVSDISEVVGDLNNVLKN